MMFTLRSCSLSLRQRSRGVVWAWHLLFDMPSSCWDLDVPANAERLCDYLREPNDQGSKLDRRSAEHSWICDP